MSGWEAPAHWQRITTIDAHAAGEPLRVICSGFPMPAGATILERREQARRQYDHLRRSLMWEPRGHADMYGCLLTPPATEDGDLGVLFLHNEGFSTMCGHGIIGLVTVGLECGLFNMPSDHAELRIDTPAGRVAATPQWQDGRVAAVSFRNVPSFALLQNLRVAVPGLGEICCDIAFGGAFYALVDMVQTGLALEPQQSDALIAAGRAITSAIMATQRIEHPSGDPDLSFLYGTIFTQSLPADSGLHSRNACVFAEGELDRSPTGTGVSARAALYHARGELAQGETLHIESIIGTRFSVRVVTCTHEGALPAVIPEVTGSASITGTHTFLIDPDDPLRDGFLLR